MFNFGHMRIFLLLVLIISCSSIQGQSYQWVFLNANPDKDSIPQSQVDSLQKGHMDNITRLANQGVLKIAGPFYGGGGIFVFNTGSVEATRELLATDPAIAANRFKIEIFDYSPKTGGICAVGADYEMVTYNFVRFDYHLNKETIRESETLKYEHNEFLKSITEKLGIIEHGAIGSQGEILVYRGDENKELILTDPAVTQGLMRVIQKQLYIARGSFCEP